MPPSVKFVDPVQTSTGSPIAKQDHKLVMRNSTATLGARVTRSSILALRIAFPISVSRPACFYPRVENDLHIRF
jgi:hypothetical protein